MSVIHLTENDIHRMVSDTVKMMLEGTDEKSGVIMYGKEDAVKEIVDFIVNYWEKCRGNAQYIWNSSGFAINGRKAGTVYRYIMYIPNSITKKLGVALNHEFEVTISDFVPDDERDLALFGHDERSTAGLSYGGGPYAKYLKAEMKFSRAAIDLNVPAVNGELQVRSLYSTLFHELNHNVTNLRINQKGFEGETLSSMNRRGNDDMRRTAVANSDPDPLQTMVNRTKFGGVGADILRAMNYMVYGLWVTTERNARVESLYGELWYMNTTPETFEEDFKESEAYHNYIQWNNFIQSAATFDNLNIWREVAPIIGYKSTDNIDLNAVRNNFIRKSKQLNRLFYKKLMKVAKFYFQQRGMEMPKAPGI